MKVDEKVFFLLKKEDFRKKLHAEIIPNR